MTRSCALALALFMILGLATPLASATAPAAPPPPPAPPAEANVSPLDPVKATEAYLARVSAEKRARSDAYYEGGYWLNLWGFLYSAAIFLLLLFTGWSARIRDFAQRVVRWRYLQTSIYFVLFLVITTLLGFPLTIYQAFVREHQYDLATQTFPAWLGEQGIALAVSAVLGVFAVSIFYDVTRRNPRSWWAWGALTMIAFSIFGAVISPVFINPLFNTYTPVTDPAMKSSILSMARANGIGVDDVFVFDASRQTTRISANVSGLLGTERISLNDNLLKQCSLPEIEMVMGHEMGHYVLNHVYELMIMLGIIFFVIFAFLHWTASRCIERWGARWRVTDVADPAGLPLLLLLGSLAFFVLTPVTNSMIRTNEAEADLFGLHASRQPDGFAEVALKLGAYRKLAPGPIEEAIFFDHPSGRSRILMAMKWKKENMGGSEK